MKNIILLVLAFICTGITAQSQDDSLKLKNVSPEVVDDGKMHIAVFTPLYLDSAYDAQMNYRYGNQMPRFINPGLEFYEGILYAVDSLERKGLQFDLHIYDTRSANAGIQNVINHPDFIKMDIILGHVNANEARIIANFAKEKEIPFVNVNFPNDVGVKNNPYYIILNSTIKTQLAGLYRYLQKYHALSPVTVVRKKGSQEDAVAKMFTDIAAGTRSVPLNLKFLTIGNDAELAELQKHFKGDENHIAIIGSLDVNFAKKAVASLALINQEHPVKVFGMPTFEVIDFSGPEYKNLDIFYGTPFPNSDSNENVKAYDELFKKEYYARTSDMVYRGIESVFYFASLLHKTGENIASSIGEGTDVLFSQFDIQPVLNPQTMQIDYYENKRIYFIQKKDGQVVSVKY